MQGLLAFLAHSSAELCLPCAVDLCHDGGLLLVTGRLGQQHLFNNVGSGAVGIECRLLQLLVQLAGQIDGQPPIAFKRMENPLCLGGLGANRGLRRLRLDRVVPAAQLCMSFVPVGGKTLEIQITTSTKARLLRTLFGAILRLMRLNFLSLRMQRP